MKGMSAPRTVRAGLFLVACASVVPLLAWVYDLGPFRAWTLLVALPGLGLLVALTVWLDRSGRWPGTRAAITAGALGGLTGTLGYDLFRVPFVFLGGMQLLAPIESYGVLLLGASTSSGLSGLAGWAYHLLNGMGFGIAYAVVARGRHWGWGVAWAMILETAVVISPFATDYALRTDAGLKVIPIVIAYLAHVPYGIVVGLAARNADSVHRLARGSVRRPVLAISVFTLVGLALWQWPLSPTRLEQQGNAVAAGPSAVIVNGRMFPTWARVGVDDCITIRNDDAVTHHLDDYGINASEGVSICDRGAGIHRLQVDEVPFSGGWLIVDDQA